VSLNGTSPEGHGLDRIEPLQDLTNLRLKQDDEQNHKDLPKDLKDPRGQKEPPGSSHRKYDAQNEKPDQGPQGFGPPEPKIKMVRHSRQKQNIQDILGAKIVNNCNEVHPKLSH
jgi:hypothetical protein